MKYTRLISKNSFNEKEIREAINEMFGKMNSKYSSDEFPILDSKQWENAMSLITLREHNMLKSDKRLICIGAGTEDTLFYFSQFVDLVIATDLYLEPTVWSDVAPPDFLKSPNKYSNFGLVDNLLGIHSDALDLMLPSNFFDAAFSCGSLEHFGGIENSKRALIELNRVLKEGGIASISTEFRIRGPNNKNSWGDDTYLFSLEDIKSKLLPGTGFEIIGDLSDLEPDEETLATRQNLSTFLEVVKNTPRQEHIREVYPNLVLYHDGFLFCSVHLALRKKYEVPIVEPKKINTLSIKLEPADKSLRTPIGLKIQIIELVDSMRFHSRPGLSGMFIRKLGLMTSIFIDMSVKLKRKFQ